MVARTRIARLTVPSRRVAGASGARDTEVSLRSWSSMKSALVALVLFAAAPALAQSGERRGFIGYSVGPAAPFGAFADVSPTNERDGRAFPGYSSNLVNVVYPIGQRFSVAASGTYSEYVWRDGGDDDW